MELAELRADLQHQVEEERKKDRVRALQSEVDDLRKELSRLRANEEPRTGEPASTPCSGPAEEDIVSLSQLRGMPHVVRKADELLAGESTTPPPATGRSTSLNSKSGRREKPTDHVSFPQAWPHAHLAHHMLRTERDYFDLSWAEFIAGYANILSSLDPISTEFRARLKHLQTLMVYATSYNWSTVLDLHSAILMEIERGTRSWGESFADVETIVLNTSAGRPSVNTRGVQKSSRSSVNGASGKRSLFYCQKWQTDECSLDDEHTQFINGKSRIVKHVCATCALTDNVARQHRYTDKVCPHYKQ